MTSIGMITSALNGHNSQFANDIFSKQLKHEAIEEVVKKYKQVTYFKFMTFSLKALFS